MNNYQKITARNLLSDYLHDVVLIDVRDPEEFASVHIHGSINIPLDCLTAVKVTDQLNDRDKTVCLVCLKGMRSIKAADKIIADLSNPLMIIEDGIETLSDQELRIGIE